MANERITENVHVIIVVECKASVTQHESQNRKQYGSYAVDGVLLYASFLSKEYDVLAIAVSGDDNNISTSMPSGSFI